MTPPADTDRYKNHRFPSDIISHGVWLYYRFTLSYRDVQELLLERGIDVSHEAIHGWCQKFGQDYACQDCQFGVPTTTRLRKERDSGRWFQQHLSLTGMTGLRTRLAAFSGGLMALAPLGG